VQLVEHSVKFLNPEETARHAEHILKNLELAARVCYKSEGNIGPGTDEIIIGNALKRGHESVIEHESFTFRVITDRGVTHEWVRHRLASYSQESTRYCNYGKMGIKFIVPADFTLLDEDFALLEAIEKHYNWCLDIGRLPQQARYFLPNGLKTEIVVTMNMRELRHFFALRTDKAAHPDMRLVAGRTLNLCKATVPILFDEF
jgi:thymidylate synthase (FAD)